MTKKPILLLAAVVALGGISLYLNWERWFPSAPLEISHRFMPPRPGQRQRRGETTRPVVFLFNHELKLTSVKVVLADAFATNPYVLPIWELTSVSNSIPTKDFIYGLNIPGMKPAVKGAVADLLQSNVTYRLIIEAGKTKAEHEFTPVPR